MVDTFRTPVCINDVLKTSDGICVPPLTELRQISVVILWLPGHGIRPGT